jgi:hypothetical protein
MNLSLDLGMMSTIGFASNINKLLVTPTFHNNKFLST